METELHWKVPERYYAAIVAADPTVIGLAMVLEDCAFTHEPESKSGVYGSDPGPLYVDQATVLLERPDIRERLIAFLTGKKPGEA